MSRTNYERGIEKERKAMECLEVCGFLTMRTAGSHGIFDVIALGPTGVRFIQIKRVKQDESWTHDYENAVENIKLLPQHEGVSYEIWVWVDYSGFEVMDEIEENSIKSLIREDE